MQLHSGAAAQENVIVNILESHFFPLVLEIVVVTAAFPD